MSRLDFWIKCENQPTEQYIANKLIHSLTVARIKRNMPSVIIVTGPSGSGKSWFVQKIVDGIYQNEEQIDYVNFVQATTVMNPLEYGDKLTNMLHDKELKHCFVLIIDEARVIVGSDQWNNFINHTISHVNAMSRAIKPLVVFIITQTIKDIDASTRRTVNYEFKVVRPLHDRPLITPYAFYMNEKDIENPRLCRRRVQGLLKFNEYTQLIKPFFKVVKPRNEIREVYEKLMVEGKSKLLNNKMNALLDRLQKETKDVDFSRVESVFNDLISDPDMLVKYGKSYHHKWRLDPKFALDHNFNKIQARELEARLTAHFKNNEKKGDVTDG